MWLVKRLTAHWKSKACGILLGLLVVAMPVSHAEDQGIEAQQQRYLTGTVDGIDGARQRLVVNDEQMNLMPVVEFNGMAWSREQLLNQLEEGDTIRFQLKLESVSNREGPISVSEMPIQKIWLVR